MVKIYCITDCNGLHYVGSTIKTLSQRLSIHKNHKKTGIYYSSSKLDLDNCEIDLLEQCEECDRKERERFYINKIDCVNDNKLNFDKDQYDKRWKQQNRDKILVIQKRFRQKNGHRRKFRDKERKQYQYSWGGDLYYSYSVNLLRIDVNLFNYP